MKILMFYHSLVSDWNHGNAHFLRGIAAELLDRGHTVHVYEPRQAWSTTNLVEEHGLEPIRRFYDAYPTLRPCRYQRETLDLHRSLKDTDLVLVHEWNEPELVAAIGEYRSKHDHFRLFFHDTHHRMVTAPESMARYDLRHYDGVLAYGAVLKDLYIERQWAKKAFVWHEAADTRMFRPLPKGEFEGDLVWVGNWGDEERTAELHEFLIEPCRELGLRATVYGVRYPQHARDALANAGIRYGGWLPNFEAPAMFSKYKVTVHVPRRPYVTALKGIPTIRPFEALACGIPLVCSPWNDSEGLFRPGTDYLVANDGAEMTSHLRSILSNQPLADTLAESGLNTIHARHTCSHRVEELLGIYQECMTTDPISSTPRSRDTESLLTHAYAT